MNATAPASQAQSLQCMEVWGGNQAIDTGLSIPGLDVWVYSRPFGDHASGGGDVHYVSQCGTGRIGRFLVADVSGHGEAVAQIAGTLRSLMRRFVNYVDQSSFVGRINQEFSRLAQAGCFATAVVMTYWAPTDYLVLCNAGHPRPFWFKSKSRRWEVLEPAAEESEAIANLPLGILEPTTYDQIGVRLSPGDFVLVYTDSLVECRDASGKMLGEDGLRHLISSLDPSEPWTLVPRLIDAIQNLRGGTPPDDDMTVLLLRHNGGKPKRLSIGEWVGVSRRFVGMVGESLRSRAAAIPWPQLRLDNVLGTVLSGMNNRLGGNAADGVRARLGAQGSSATPPPEPPPAPSRRPG